MSDMRIVLDSSGSFRETTVREPIVLDKMLAAYVRTLEFVLPFIAKDTYMVTTKSGGWALVRRIRTLFFNSRSFMTVTPGDKPEDKPTVNVYPWCCYTILRDPATGSQPEVVPGPAAVPFTMAIPDTAALLHVILLSKDIKYANSGIALIDLRTGKSYHPPLPNVYGDGRICNGAQTDQAFISWKPHEGLDALSKLSTKEFDNGVWNCDLINGEEDQCKAITLFHKYDTETKKAQPWPDNWHTLVRQAAPGVDLSSAVSALMGKGLIK